ncbi:MAG TPA: RCC1 domain-containing protein, partial [Gemmatimonadales bacterium]|nr:RCC1 domain-containing protein [Gemmatimonadales bacterium]
MATLGSWTLGGTAGTNAVQATVPGIPGALGFTALATLPLPPAPSYNTLAAGDSHSCGVAADGDTYCWGLVPPAAVPMPMEPSNATTRPAKVSGGVAFVTLEAGERFTCGLTAAGAAWCWGAEFAGDLGDGG